MLHYGCFTPLDLGRPLRMGPEHAFAHVVVTSPDMSLSASAVLATDQKTLARREAR